MPIKETTPIYVLLPLLLVLIIDSMSMGIIFPVLSALFSQNHNSLISASVNDFWRNCLYSVVMGSASLTMFLGSPLLGDLSDRLGRKKVLLLSLLGNSICFLISALGIYWHSITVLVMGRALSGFTAASQPLAQAAIIDVSSSKNKALNMTLISVAGGAGFIIGPIIGGYFSNTLLSHWFSFSTPFYIACALALINAACLASTFRET